MTRSEIDRQLENWDSLRHQLDLITQLQNQRQRAWDQMISFRETRRTVRKGTPYETIWKKAEQRYKRSYWEACEAIRQVMWEQNNG